MSILVSWKARYTYVDEFKPFMCLRRYHDLITQEVQSLIFARATSFDTTKPSN